MLHFTWVSTMIPSTHEALPRSTGDTDMKIERREISQKVTQQWKVCGLVTFSFLYLMCDPCTFKMESPGPSSFSFFSFSKMWL